MLRGIFSPRFRNIVPKPLLFYFSRYDSRLGASYVYTTNAKSETSHTVKITNEIFSAFASDHFKMKGPYFEPTEDIHFHKVLERSSRYEGSVFTETMLRDELCDPASCNLEAFNEQDLSSLSDAELVEIYRKVTSYAVSRNIPMTEDCFTRVCAAVRSKMCSSRESYSCILTQSVRLDTFTSENLITVGKLFALWPPCESVHDGHFKSFYVALDDACINMYQENPVNYLLNAQMADLWYWSRLGRKARYLKYSVGHCVAEARELQYIIQFLFYLNIMRSLPPHFDSFRVEAKLLEVEPVCTLDELALVSTAFFKTKSNVQNYSFQMAVLKRLKEGAPDVNEITLNSLCKVLKHSFPKHRRELHDIQDIVTSRVPDLSVGSLLSLAEISIKNVAVGKSFMRALYVKVLNSCTCLRLKDLCRAFSVLTEYSLYFLDIQELAKRVEEVIRSPEMQKQFQLHDDRAACLLHHLMLCDICPMELVENLMISTNSKIVRQSPFPSLFNIDVMLEVFYPDYKGERLNAKIRKEVYEEWFGIKGKRRVMYEGGTSFNCRQYTEWKDIFKCVFNNQMDHFMVIHMVPSSSFVDIVICYDKKGSLVPIPKELLEYKPWELKRIPQCVRDDGKNLIVFTFVGRDSISYSMIRHQREKKKILKKLGYHIIPIDLGEWVGKVKAAYLLKLLDSLRELK